MRVFHGLACILASGLFATAGEARAEPTSPQPPMAFEDGGWAFTLQMENDYFDIVGLHSDRYYTHGSQLSVLAPSGTPVAVLRPLIDLGVLGEGAVGARYGFTLGQNIYTPEEVFLAEPDPSDRPYAGWAFVGATAITHSRDVLTSLELQVGVVGPSALAGEAQNGLHRIRKFALVEGWEYQLQDEFAFVLLGERRRRVDVFPSRNGFGMDGTLDTGVAVGTVRISASVGATLRLGWGLDDDFGAPRIRPSPSPAAFFRETRGWSAYGFVSASGQLVGRDIFLDGNTWQDSPSVDRRPFVPEAQAGVVIRIGPFRGAYSHVWRGEEFRGQNGEAEFGSASITFVKPLN